MLINAKSKQTPHKSPKERVSIDHLETLSIKELESLLKKLSPQEIERISDKQLKNLSPQQFEDLLNKARIIEKVKKIKEKKKEDKKAAGKAFLLDLKRSEFWLETLERYEIFIEEHYREIMGQVPKEEKKKYHIENILSYVLYISIFQALLATLLRNIPLWNTLLNGILSIGCFSALIFIGRYTPKKQIRKLFIVALQHSLVVNMFLLGILSSMGKIPWALSVLSLSGAWLICFFGLREIPIYKDILEEVFFMGYKDVYKKKGYMLLGTDWDTGLPCAIPYKDFFLHMFTDGATGSGKTSQILLPITLQTILSKFSKPWGMTILEPKGEFAIQAALIAKSYGKECKLFYPADKNCPYWNVLYGDEDTAIQLMVRTFKMCSSDSKSFFLNQNEQVLTKGLKIVKRLHGNNATLIHLADLMNNFGDKGINMANQIKFLSADPIFKKENEDLGEWFLKEYFPKNSKVKENTSDIMALINKLCSNAYLRKILNPPEGRNDLNFDKILENGEYLFMTSAQGDLGPELSNFLGFLLILSFQAAVLRRPGVERTRNPHTLILDEAQTYANPGMSDLLSQGRSYRVASILATQNREQLGMNTSTKNPSAFINLVTTNCRNLVIFPGGIASEAKFFADQFGEYNEVKKVKSERKLKIGLDMLFAKPQPSMETHQIQERLKAAFSITDLIYQKFKTVTVRIVRNNDVQFPQRVNIDFIPRKVTEQMDTMVEKYLDNIQKDKVQFYEDKERRLGQKYEPVKAEKPLQGYVTPQNIVLPKKEQVDNAYESTAGFVIEDEEEIIID